jgi:hypothetical protein
MKVQFNKPVTIAGVTYGKGTHDVSSDDASSDWYFDALVKDGDAVILRDDEAVEVVENKSKSNK